ncbi:hypothetical protein C8R46DRAFT_1001993 [Mycena filopes]|nr:hypothetical protein C8R46DRAFT_1001993 [Mycena filopes]
MSTVVPPNPSISIVQVSGPLLVGYLLHWGLFGTLAIQLYLYYEGFPRDRVSSKALVYTVCTLELVETIFVTHDAFAIYGYGFLDPSALTKIHFDWLSIPIISGIVAFLGQSFYAYRLYIVSQSWVLPCLILIVSPSSILVGERLSGRSRFPSLAANTQVWCGASALSDIIIAACMTYYLTKRDTQFRETHVLISKLTRLIIETGSLTAAVAVVNLVLFLAFPHNSYYTTPGGILPKLYANTILVIFNSRIQIVGGRNGRPLSSEVISMPRFRRDTTGHTESEDPTVVSITREVFSQSDLRDQVEMKVIGVS